MRQLLGRLWTEWRIAIQFLRDGRLQTAMILTGIAVGVAVVVFISALIQGLQVDLIDRTLGSQAHIRLLPPEERNLVLPAPPGTLQLLQEDKRAQRLRSINNWQQVVELLDGLPGLSAVSPVVSGPAFARRGVATESVAIVGIDLPRYQDVVPLQRYLREGSLRVGADNTLIGRLLADDLGLRVGDKLRLEGSGAATAVLNVAGIFELGVRELDERYVYLDLKQAQALVDLPGGATVIDLRVPDIFSARDAGERLARLTGLKAESWMETNAQLLSGLTAQSLSTNMIMLFVGLSVAFGIASVLSVSVGQRTREIGILRATGAGRGQILRVFLLQGALFGLCGSLLGLAASYALVWSFNTLGPGLFQIPISAGLMLSALLLAMLTGVLAALLPARRAAYLDPVEAIRYV